MLLFLFACTDGAAHVDTGPDPCVDAHDVGWTSFGDGFFATYCRSCHSAGTPDRHGAPEGVDFDTADQVRAQSASIRRAVLDAGTMPVGGGVYADDLVLLDELLTCGL